MAKRGENIHKRKDKRWEGRCRIGTDENGRIIYKSVYGKTYGEVKEKMRAFISNGNNCEQKRDGVLFCDVLNAWLESGTPQYRDATQLKYQSIIELHIKPELGSLPIAKVTAANLNAFIEKKLNEDKVNGRDKLSPSYVRTMALIANAAYKYAVSENLCVPFRSPVYKPIQRKAEVDVLSDREQKYLQDTLSPAKDTTELGIYLTLNTGLRLGELCALRWSDIDMEERVIKVRHTITRAKAETDNGAKTKTVIGSPKTPSSLRTIPVNTALFKALSEAKKAACSEFVVSQRNSFVPPRTFEYRYRRCLERLSVRNINFHALRHTFATRCVNAGIDAKTVSELLGHSNVSITLNTYVHSSMEKKKREIEKIVF